MVKYLLAALLSVALIQVHGGSTPALTNETRTKVATVRPQATVSNPVQPQVVEAVAQVPVPPPVQPQPETVVARPQGTGCNAYKSLVSRYDWNVTVMTAIMRAESSCNPNAVNRHNYDGVYDYGLLQLHGQRIYDPAANVAAAHRLWKVQGYRAWSAYKSGSYRKYL